MSARPVALTIALMSLSAIVGSQGKNLIATAHAQSATPQAAPALPAAAIAGGEQSLDTDTRPATPAKPAPKAVVNDPSMPNGYPAVRTVADEDLPKWVPKSGRLTVVSSYGLRENLGLPPAGQAADESAARKTAASDPMTKGSSWNYARPGRVTVRRF